MALTSLSLFSGVVGLDLAVDLAFGPVWTVGYVERDPYAAAVLLARMEDATLGAAPVWCDEVEGLDPRPFRGVDLVTAGINCQPWSCAGQRKGIKDERWIWPEVERVLRIVEPRYLVLECTPGLVAGGLELILADLANLGFDAEWGLLPASAVGAPQRRLRFFLLADAYERGRSDIGGEPRHHRHPRRHPDRQGRSFLGHSDSGRWRADQHDDDAWEPDAVGCIFPPGPDDLGAWREVLRADPTLEPSLRRVAAGTPGGVDGYHDPARKDRLRALGNAVCPVAGAAALRLLAERGGLMVEATA